MVKSNSQTLSFIPFRMAAITTLSTSWDVNSADVDLFILSSSPPVVLDSEKSFCKSAD
jgi:hypothetical protein